MFGGGLNKVEKAIERRNTKSLIELADARDQDVRLAAIGGLGKVGGDDATNTLITLLHDGDAQVRVAVAQALGMIGDMHTKAHVSAQMAKETDPVVREAIGKAMASIKGY